MKALTLFLLAGFAFSFAPSHFPVAQAEEEIKEELRLLAASIEVPITPAYEELVVVV